MKQCIQADVRDCFLNNLVLQDIITVTLNHDVLHVIIWPFAEGQRLF